MMNNILKYTGKNMDPLRDRFLDLLDGSAKYSYLKLVDRVDIEAFIGLLRAAFRLNILDREVTSIHQSASDFIGATMSLHRFKFICCLITLDDSETRNDSWKTDKFAYMRELFEDMNETNTKIRHLFPLLAIDETCIHIADMLDLSILIQINQNNIH